MTRSQRSRKGYVPLQAAHHDRPWARQDKVRKDEYAQYDLSHKEEELQGGECFLHQQKFAACKKCTAPFCSQCATWKPSSFTRMNKEEFCDTCRTKAYEDDLRHQDWLDDMRDYLDT